jgi:ankyrin repeat protein
MFKKLKLSAVGVDECKVSIEDILSKEDNYGNNALALACIYNNKLKKDIKRKCVQFLLDHGSNPNVRNRLTGFTPLHWACLYNEE